MTTILLLAATALAITAMICAAASHAWQGWLELKRLELAARSVPAGEAPHADVGVRIELAGVRERLRKLEEIASVVEL